MAGFLRIPCIDDAAIPESVIYNCKRIYETWGKTRVYDKLDEEMYKYEYAHNVTNRTLRYLNLYRHAFLETKCHFDNSNIENTNLTAPKVLDVDETTYCKYCGKPLVESHSTDPIGTVIPEKTFKHCDNPNCYMNLRFYKKRKWEFTDYNANVPYFDKKLVGYVSVNGFKLDNYCTYDYAYTNTQLSLKGRGFGIGFPRTFRFDFEYRYYESAKNSGADKLKIYEDILFNTFKECFHSILVSSIYTLASQDDVNAMLAAIAEMSDEIKIDILKFINDFIAYQKKYHDVRPKNDEDAELDFDNSRKQLSNKLKEFHELFMLPCEFMSYLIILTLYPRHMFVLSDTKGGISSQLFFGGNVFTPTINSKYGISLDIGERVIDTCFIDKVPRYIDSDGLTLYDNYYVMMSGESFAVYSFTDGKWMAHDECALVSSGVIESDGCKPKLYAVKLHSKNCVAIHTSSRISVFSFDDNDFIYDISFDPEQVIVDSSYDPQLDRFYAITSSKLYVYEFSSTQNEYVKLDGVELTAEPVGTENSEPTEFDQNDTLIESSDTTNKPLSEFSKIYVNNRIVIARDDGSVDTLTYLTLAGTNGNVQIIKVTDDGSENTTEFSVFKDIKFNNTSEVVSIFSLDSMQRVFVAFANKRVIVLNTYMYNISVLQKAINDDERLIYATKLFQHNMYYLAYVTSKDDAKNVHAFYETGIGNVTAGQTTLSKLIKSESDVVTYDELFAAPSNIELWSQDVLRLGSMQSKYKHLSQR